MGIIIEYRMREKGFGRRMCLVYIPVHSLQERVGKSLQSGVHLLLLRLDRVLDCHASASLELMGENKKYSNEHEPLVLHV